MNRDSEHSVEVHYFAVLKEKAGCAKETAKISGMTSYSELYSMLAEKHQFLLSPHEIQVAVNDEFTDLNQMVLPGSKIVFIPPVSGG